MDLSTLKIGDVVKFYTIDELKEKYDDLTIDMDSWRTVIKEGSRIFLSPVMIKAAELSEVHPQYGVVYEELQEKEGEKFVRISFWKNREEIIPMYIADWMIEKVDMEGMKKPCKKCGKEHSIFNMYSVEGYDVCTECYEGLPECPICHKKHLSCNTVFNNGAELTVCTKCYEDTPKCHRCGVRDVGCISYDGNQYCPDCISAMGLRMCTECGDFFHPVGAGTRCPSCTRANSVRGYHHAPPITFNRTDEQEANKHYYIGFELELGGAYSRSAVTNTCGEIIETYGEDKVFFEHDGSICGYGAEMISQPMTFNYHRGFDWETILGKFSTTCKSVRGCGLHIHVGKKAFVIGNHEFVNTTARETFNEHQWAKVDLFINSNRSFWERLARRSSTHYAYYRGSAGMPLTKDSFKRNYGSGKSSSRYVSVNFQPENTVEFRIFKSTKNIKHLRASIEFVDAIIQWIPNAPLNSLLNPQTGIAVQSYCDFIKRNRLKYSNAYSYLKSRKLV